MSYTFKLTGGTADELAIARVRSEIDDVTAAEDGGTEGTDHFLSDARILSALTGAGALYTAPWAIVYQAAAACQDTLADNQAYRLKVKTTMGEDVDGAAVSKAIRDGVKSREARARQAQAAADVAGATGAARAMMVPDGGAVQLNPVYTP